MISHKIFLLSVFCVLYLHGSGVSALECYSCTNCNDPFKSSEGSTLTCSDSCMKTKGEKDGSQFVIRGCGSGNTNKCDKQKYMGVDVNVCTCTSNLCNGANDMKMRLTVTILCAVILAIAGKVVL